MLMEMRATTLAARLIMLEAAVAADRAELLGDAAASTRLASLPADQLDVHAALVTAESDGAFLHSGLQLHAAFGQLGQLL